MTQLRLIVGSLVVMGLLGCTPPPPSTELSIETSPIIGNWTIPGSQDTPTESIQFFEDGRFIITTEVSNNVLTEGMYSVTANELILQYGGEAASGDCTMAAAYNFSIDGDTIQFDRIMDDLCGSRIEQFNKIWSFKQ